MLDVVVTVSNHHHLGTLLSVPWYMPGLWISCCNASNSTAILAIGQLLGELLADYLAAANIMKPDLLIPVPLHDARLRKRGFNQALELARPVARRLRLPSPATTYVCAAKTPPCNPSWMPMSVAAICMRLSQSIRSLKGAHVAILDDVLTTGATASALTLTLRQAGAASVQIWCLARAARIS